MAKSVTKNVAKKVAAKIPTEPVLIGRAMTEHAPEGYAAIANLIGSLQLRLMKLPTDLNRVLQDRQDLADYAVVELALPKGLKAEALVSELQVPTADLYVVPELVASSPIGFDVIAKLRTSQAPQLGSIVWVNADLFPAVKFDRLKEQTVTLVQNKLEAQEVTTRSLPLILIVGAPRLDGNENKHQHCILQGS